MNRPALFTVLSLAPLFAFGCGPSDRMVLAPVSGTVTYNGKPLKTGHITLVPAKGRSAAGRIVDGAIVDVTTYQPGDGAAVGAQRVQIASFVREPQGMEIVPWVIPERYGNVETSGLTTEIVPRRPNELTFELHD